VLSGFVPCGEVLKVSRANICVRTRVDLSAEQSCRNPTLSRPIRMNIQKTTLPNSPATEVETKQRYRRRNARVALGWLNISDFLIC